MEKTKNKNTIPEGQYYKTEKNRCCRKLARLRTDDLNDRGVIEKVKEILENKY